MLGKIRRLGLYGTPIRDMIGTVHAPGEAAPATRRGQSRGQSRGTFMRRVPIRLKLTLAPRGLLTALQDERAYATLDLTGLPLLVPEPRRGFDVTRAATDEAARAFRDELARANPAVQEAYAPAVAGLATLDEGRVVVDRYGGPREAVDSAISAGRDAVKRYTAILTPL